MFFLYPDPHFKRMKHKWRIITPSLLATYAYLLAPGGRLYSATDVPELADWIVLRLMRHPLFRRIVYVRLQSAINAAGVESCRVVTEVDENLATSTNPHDSTHTGEQAPVKVPNGGSQLVARLTTQADFEQIARDEPVVRMLAVGATEEAKKAAREGRGTSIIVFERLPNPDY